MNHEALRHAVATVAKTAGISAAGAIALTTAVWLPTLALQNFASLPFLDAYLLGFPVGLLIATLIGLGVMTYWQKVREP